MINCDCPTTTPAKEQVPLFDTLGPFADEMFMTSIDHLLLLLGGNRLQKFLGVTKECSDFQDCEQDEIVQSCKERKVKIVCSPDVKNSCSVCNLPCCACVKASVGMVAPCLRRSFSLCSLACRRLKNKLCPAVADSQIRCRCNPKWLWTRVRCLEQGIKVYEIFKNSCTQSDPRHLHGNSDKLILIAMPSGCVIPFETVPCHN